MSCPKVNPRYPNTATLLERPFATIVRKIDPDFDKVRRKERAYEFQRRFFTVDPMLHGAYVPVEFDFASGDFDDYDFNTLGHQFQLSNGFCESDPPVTASWAGDWAGDWAGSGYVGVQEVYEGGP